MQVLCIAAPGEQADVACPVCGSTYKVYYSRSTGSEREEAASRVRRALQEHHDQSSLGDPHPREAFNLPEWNGPAHMSAAALLGGAPITRARRYPIEGITGEENRAS